jgi:hypothetical protein
VINSVFRRASYCAALACLCISPACLAQQLVVGSGARLVMGSSIIDAGCRDVQIAGRVDIASGALQGVNSLSVSGSLNGGSGLIALSGDLSAASTLNAQSGTVRISDGCGSAESQLIGDHQFNNFQVQTSAPHALELPAGGTQVIASSLQLVGGAALLEMRSASPGVVSFLSLPASGTQLVDRVDAIDVGGAPFGQYLAPGPAELYNSIDRGNTPRFFGEETALPIPTLSVNGLAALLLLIAGFALTQLRTLNRGEN